MVNIGDVYGIYRVIEDTDTKTADHHRIYLLQCIHCNKFIQLPANKFAYGKNIVHSCKHDKISASVIKNKRLREIYRHMYNRCYNISSKDYRFYGAKGITICDEWLIDPKVFEKWSKKNGYKKNLTIDRIKSSGPYASWNCRWISGSDNAKYKSTTTIYTINGITDTGRGWAKRLDIGTNRINSYRRKYGKAFTERFIDDQLNGFITLKPKI